MALSAEEKKEDFGKAEDVAAAKVEKTEPVEKKKVSKDAEINTVGAAAETVKPAAAATVNAERAAIVFMAKQLLTPADLEDFKALYPRLFE